MQIPQCNPSLSLIAYFEKQQGFLYEASKSYEEVLWNAMTDQEILLHYGVEGQALLLRNALESFALALRLSGVREGDLVLFPCNGRYEFARLLISLGVRLVFIDIDHSRLSISLEGIKRGLSEVNDWRKQTKRFLVVDHFLGITPSLPELKDIAEKEQLQIIEIATESQSELQDASRSTLGGYKILSLGEFAEGIGASGTMLLCPTEERCQKGRSLLRSLSEKGVPDPVIPALIGDLRLPSILLLRAYVELTTGEEKKKKRESLFDTYKNGLQNILGLDLFQSSSLGVAPLQILLSVDDSLLHFSKNELVVRLQEKGVEAVSLRKPLHTLPFFEKCPCYLNGLAEGWYDKAMLLPCGSGLSLENAREVVKEIHTIVRHFN